jgi:hypothetical protein
MKIVIISMFLCLFIACNNEENIDSQEPNLNNLLIIHGPCGKLAFKGKIGNNFDSALDSLLRIHPSLGYDCIEKDTIIVDFNYDDRHFISNAYMDANCESYIVSIGDVLDSMGNYYGIWWCED